MCYECVISGNRCFISVFLSGYKCVIGGYKCFISGHKCVIGGYKCFVSGYQCVISVFGGNIWYKVNFRTNGPSD